MEEKPQVPNIKKIKIFNFFLDSNKVVLKKNIVKIHVNFESNSEIADHFIIYLMIQLENQQRLILKKAKAYRNASTYMSRFMLKPDSYHSEATYSLARNKQKRTTAFTAALTVASSAKYVVQVFHQSSYRVTMSSDQYSLAIFDLRDNAVMPEWQKSLNKITAYLGSFSGSSGSLASISGDLKIIFTLTCSSPCLAAVSDLFKPCKPPYILSLSLHVFKTGIQCKSSSSWMKNNVLIALFKTLCEKIGFGENCENYLQFTICLTILTLYFNNNYFISNSVGIKLYRIISIKVEIMQRYIYNKKINSAISKCTMQKAHHQNDAILTQFFSWTLNLAAKIASWNGKKRQSTIQDGGHMIFSRFQVAIVGAQTHEQYHKI
ncbi:hypothetical protein BpHYR1_044584 [Brachionus plicatilis]|uniref:Uncharacterized protein n=1 Tax=Brachionus plicatilis TaxID=10195 RepID=A0A3M7SCN2_BRAPC|nr:hypothetical protein BpHYR1_044584 [Brachionus plicatilis]